jgi:predicted helicase
MSAIADYLGDLGKHLATGDATENTYRPALRDLLQASGTNITATNEPKHIPLIGAPDFKVSRGQIPLGHIETKDIGTDLAEMEKGKGPNAEQFSRYRSLPNWILTDYLEFRWYVHGERRRTVRIAELGGKKKIKLLTDTEQQLADLLTAFFQEPALTVSTPQELADSMAGYTRTLRHQSIAALQQETATGWLHQWLAAFREVLIPELDETVFADMFAQTLAYGLFAARVNALRHAPNKDFTLEMAAFNTPKTNPFLHKLFKEIAGDLPDTIRWTVDDIVELLRHANMEAILKDFGKGKGKDDPVVHFYETFLAAYDPKLRELRGVFYTPLPVVRYIVRSIDHLLKTRFNRPAGLADENTLILDPATGTATFPYEVIRYIWEQRFQNQPGAWNRYVPEKLLPRIFGFELLMAPYAVAHLKLAMLLEETGYKFEADQRLGVYLTNTLEQTAHISQQLVMGFLRELTAEANAAADIKAKKPIMVVVGNPPYANYGRMNRGKWILSLLNDYKQGLNEKKLNLDDDFIKFIRFAQWRIEHTKYGVVGFITNNTYLDGITHRRMRECLLETFDEMYILNLHGSAKKQETAPDGSSDQNVFDITVGVSIVLFVKTPHRLPDGPVVHYADLWGERETKYAALSEQTVASTDWKTLRPKSPHFFLAPRQLTGSGEYLKFWRVTDIFQISQNGLKTDRDELFFDFDKPVLRRRMEAFFTQELDAHFRGKYRVEASSSYDIEAARRAAHFDVKHIHSCLYRPFDTRWLYYDHALTSRPAEKVMRHMLAGQNLALLCMRQTRRGEQGPFFVGRGLINKDAVSLFDIGTVFPLYLYEASRRDTLSPKLARSMTLALFETPAGYATRQHNFTPAFVSDVTTRLKLNWIPIGCGDLKKTVGPEDVFHYAYAVFHSPTYRQRYAEFLKIDFPRLPLTGNVKLFRALAAKGAELVALHLLEAPKLSCLDPQFCGMGDNTVEKVQYTDTDQRVWVNASQYFDAVPKEAWEFHIGGYQPCQKWLKDRKGRTLTYDDMQHYQQIVVAQTETIRLMAGIDALIPKWPLE